MKWAADTIQPKPLHFVIEQSMFRSVNPDQPNLVGFYLYVYQDGQEVYDYLQDTLDIAKNFAFKKFNVPLDAWKLQE